MRLKILESGHAFGTKALFALIRAASRQQILDVIKLVKYRPDFYGTHVESDPGSHAWSLPLVGR